jgi:hypothetical protein
MTARLRIAAASVEAGALETVRGVRLPFGMTRGCAEALACLFNERADPDCEASNLELAVRAFAIVGSHQR